MVVFLGDFRQILSVVLGGSEGLKVPHCITSAKFWPNATILPLSVNERVNQRRIQLGTLLKPQMRITTHRFY